MVPVKAVRAGDCRVFVTGQRHGTGALAVAVQPDGTATVARAGTAAQVAAETLLEGAGALQNTTLSSTAKGDCIVSRTYASGVTTMETFAGDGAGGVRWSFTAAFLSARRVPVNMTTTITVQSWAERGWRWWTTWSKTSKDGSTPSPLVPSGTLTNTSAGAAPLYYNYGGAKFNLDKVSGLPNLPTLPMMNGFALPIFSFLKPATSIATASVAGAVSFLGDPTDMTTYLTLSTTEATAIDTAIFSLSRRLLGVSSKTPLKLAGNWVSHQDCWRPALGAFWWYHPKFAKPDPHVNMALTEGTATYAYFFEQPGFQPF